MNENEPGVVLRGSATLVEFDHTAVLAFFLPQYHPVPENDEWWGAGFTEWRNVAAARPQFGGHYQPHIPADLGFYDLRVAETREHQAQMASQYGIDGFAYYHYWFNGRRILERPVNDMLLSGEPDFPFLIVWANENWTRRWDGGDDDVLLSQSYSPADDLQHILALKPTLTDPRYICRYGKPVIGIYRSSLLPSPRSTINIWQAEVRRWGLPGLYVLRIESFPDEHGDPRSSGFDAAVNFQPSFENIPSPPLAFSLRYRLRRLTDRWSHRVYRYRDMADLAVRMPDPDYPRWPGVTPGFDNSARRKRAANIALASSPNVYRDWLKASLLRSDRIASRWERHNPGFVFVNAWNEWAEGNHLEPDKRFGMQFLEANLSAVIWHRDLSLGVHRHE